MLFFAPVFIVLHFLILNLIWLHNLDESFGVLHNLVWFLLITGWDLQTWPLAGSPESNSFTGKSKSTGANTDTWGNPLSCPNWFNLWFADSCPSPLSGYQVGCLYNSFITFLSWRLYCEKDLLWILVGALSFGNMLCVRGLYTRYAVLYSQGHTSNMLVGTRREAPASQCTMAESVCFFCMSSICAMLASWLGWDWLGNSKIRTSWCFSWLLDQARKDKLAVLVQSHSVVQWLPNFLGPTF